MPPLTRRNFLASAGAAAALPALARATLQDAPDPRPAPGDDHRGPAAISSGNGVAAVTRALELIREGVDPVLAVVDGVGIVEADPKDMTVGLGGLPNEEGVVELDASVMHGPTHKAGGVAALRNVVHAARVALKVLQTTDHCLIVGEGALRFARLHGFEEANLLTPQAREAWLRWKRGLSPVDDWLDDDQMDWATDGLQRAAPAEASARVEDPAFTYGTIHCGATDAGGNVSACTTTSGLSYKIPGRVGDSPIIGAGMYVDNEVGSAGATGRGEAVIQSCGAYSVVRHMKDGKSPTQACLAVLREIADRSAAQRALVNAKGRPNFNVVLYALRKDGAYGSASMWAGAEFAVATGAGALRQRCAALFEGP